MEVNSDVQAGRSLRKLGEPLANTCPLRKMPYVHIRWNDVSRDGQILTLTKIDFSPTLFPPCVLTYTSQCTNPTKRAAHRQGALQVVT